MEDLFRPAGQSVEEAPATDDLVVIRAADEPTARKSRAKRVLLVVSLSLVAVMLVVTATGFLYVRHLENIVSANLRTAGNPFSGLDERARPTKTNDALDMLVLAADTRLDLTSSGSWAGDAKRLDAVLLVHVNAGRSTVQVVTLPRLTETVARNGARRTLSDVLAAGGPSLLIATVEQVTGIRIDHLVAVDFEGFTRLTDTLGGVDVTVPPGRPAEGTRFSPGTRHMDGATALAYVREGDGRSADEALRAQRQQSWLRAIGVQALSTDLVSHPGRVGDVLEATASSLTVDATLTTSRLRSLVLSMRSVRSSDVRYATAPGAPARNRYVLSGRADQLWQSLRSDDSAGMAAALR